MDKNHKSDDHPEPIAQEHHHDESCDCEGHPSEHPDVEAVEGLEMFIPPEAREMDSSRATVIDKPEAKLLKVTPKEFVRFFPKVQLPQTLNEDSIHTFNKHNMPFSVGAEATFLHEPGDDEFTEYLPCFRVKNPYGIDVLVFWRASLLDQHYYVMTMDKKGNIIAKAPIAGIRTDGKKIARLYAHIDEDWIIHMTAGEAQIGRETEYNPGETKAFEAEIQPDGQIVFEESENLFDE